MQTTQEMAAGLINTTSMPAGLQSLKALSDEARAYDRLTPYPAYHFRDWKTEDRGPLPVCMPLAKSIVSRGAKWLFGKPLQLHSQGNPKLEEFLREMWRRNKLGSRLVAIARRGALDGGVALKFSYDDSVEVPLSIQSLSLVDEVRLFYHPHNRDQLLMARVQYTYFDPEANRSFWYREEWTAEQEVHYAPVPVDGISTIHSRNNPDSYAGWVIESITPNPFGLIPVVHIKNIETDDLWGAGDLWDLYRVLDRIHLTYHLMDKSNQFDSEPNNIFIDADVDENDIDKPLAPGQPIQIESLEGDKQAKVQQLEARGSLRPAMMEYAKDLRKQVLAAASSVEVDPADVTNKGNMTNAVLDQLFQPQIEITNEKRKTWGDDGLCQFLGRVAIGLQNAGVDLDVNAAEPASHCVTIQWPPYFEFSEDEKSEITNRTQTQETAGYLTHERAIERIAHMEGIGDVGVLLGELGVRVPQP